MSEYLDSTGLEHLVDKIGTEFAAKEDIVQSNWNESNTTANGYIQNKPVNLVTGATHEYTIWGGTQADYDNILTKDNYTLYFIVTV